MLTEEMNDCSLAYSVWFGEPVILVLVIRRCRVPVPCRIVGESVAEVRVRITPELEMNLRKELILAVEEDAVGVDREPTKYSIN
jgi:hypothetical protein